MSVSDIPALNAALNAAATILICAGWILVKRGDTRAHRACMLSAAAASAFFLAGYVAHKVLAHGIHTPFGGTAPALRAAYHGMLATHVILAMAVAYLVPRTFALALRGDTRRHRAWARWTLPIWLYVSITGVLVYFSLHVWWPPSLSH